MYRKILILLVFLLLLLAACSSNTFTFSGETEKSIRKFKSYSNQKIAAFQIELKFK